jgi:hypothetical protein
MKLDPVIDAGEIDVKLGELVSLMNENVQLTPVLQTLSTNNLELTNTYKF